MKKTTSVKPKVPDACPGFGNDDSVAMNVPFCVMTTKLGFHQTLCCGYTLTLWTLVCNCSGSNRFGFDNAKTTTASWWTGLRSRVTSLNSNRKSQTLIRLRDLIVQVPVIIRHSFISLCGFTNNCWSNQNSWLNTVEIISIHCLVYIPSPQLMTPRTQKSAVLMVEITSYWNDILWL